MNKLWITVALAAPIVLLPDIGNAKGCIKGAAVGAIAGHVAGHHAVVGAAAGCVIGHHQAKAHAKEAAQATSPPPDKLPNPQSSGAPIT
jgi:hypothetical protein